MTALAGLALLVLLPGLLVVRSPWTCVPALSLAFWVLSPWWCPSWLSRASFVTAVLVAALALLVLRFLPKHEVPPPPGWTTPPARAAPAARERPTPPFAAAASLLVAVTAALALAPALFARNAPGNRLAFLTTATRLVLFRDGIPLSSEPLLPIPAFGAHAPAIATLAADVSRTCGVPAARAVAVTVGLGVALALVGGFSLLATRLHPLVAAAAAVWTAAGVLAALAAIGLARGAPWLDRWGAGEAIVALAFLLPAAALVLGHESRSSALAAAWLIAAGALAQPVLALLVLVACAAFRGRRGVAVGTLAVPLAAPGLVPLARASSLHELARLLRAIDGLDLLALVSLAVFAMLVVRALDGRLPAAHGGVRLAVWLSGSATLVAGLAGWLACGRLSDVDRDRLIRAGESGDPLAAVCVEPALRAWVPAVAARAAAGGGSWVPPAYADELAAGSPEPCP